MSNEVTVMTDPTDVFRRIDASSIEGESYTFNILEDMFGEPEIDESSENAEPMNAKKIVVSFEQLDEDERRDRASSVLLNAALEESNHDFDHDTVIEVDGETVLVDSSMFGYELDAGERYWGYVAIFPDKAKVV